MHSIDEVLEFARRLPPKERDRLRAELDALVAEDTPPPGEQGSYAPLLALIGKGETDHTDVSTDKYKHLGGATYEHERR